MPSILNLVWIFALATLFFFPGLDVQTRITAVCGDILLGFVNDFRGRRRGTRSS